MMLEYGIFGILGLGMGGAYLAWHYKLPTNPLLWLLFVGVPAVLVVGLLYLPTPIAPFFWIAALIGYVCFYRLWLVPKQVLQLTVAEQENLATCFPNNIYHLQYFDCEADHILCMGNLRTQNHAQALRQVKALVGATVLDRWQVVLTANRTGEAVFRLLPAHPPQTNWQISLFFTVASGILLLYRSPSITYGMALLAILAARALGRYIVIKHFRLCSSWGIIVPGDPSFPIAGIYHPVVSLVPDRWVLFLLGLVPSVTGLLVAISLLLGGLIVSNPENTATTLWIGNSFLTSNLGEKIRQLPEWAIAGWSGIVITALGLLPIGKLEGGYLVQSILGSNMAGTIGRLTRLAFLALTLTRYPELIIPAFLLFLIEAQPDPAQDDLTEIPELWDIVGIILLTGAMVVLFPMVK